MPIIIATWNVALFRKPDCVGNKIESAGKRLPRIIQRILEHKRNVDVWLFNEVFFYKKELVDALKGEYPHYTDLGYKYPGLSSGLLTMSKYPITDVRKEFYKSRYGWDYFTNKGILTTYIKIGGQGFYVVNTHMQQGHSEKNNEARMNQCYQLSNHIHGLQNHKVILGGDLNMSDSTMYRRDKQYRYLASSAFLNEPEYLNVVARTTIVRFLTKNIPKNWERSVVAKTDRRWYYSDTDLFLLYISDV